MKRRLAILVFLSVAWCIDGCTGLSHSYRAYHNDEPRNIIIIGWDGVGRKQLKELLAQNKLPYLKKLTDEGSFVNIDMTSAERTETKPAWARILTGYPSEITGVYSNQQYQPIPAGYTVFERVKDWYGSDAVVAIMVTGKSGNLGGGDGEPYFLTRPFIDVFDSSKSRGAAAVGPKAIKYLVDYQDVSFLVFFHFSNPDHLGHRYGINSPEYSEAISNCDSWLGQIIDKLKELNIYHQTLIYVTSDHGFDENPSQFKHTGRKGEHFNAPYVWLATNDIKVIRNKGSQLDIAPTILERFGIALQDIQPPLGGISLRQPLPGNSKIGRTIIPNHPENFKREEIIIK